MLSECFFIVGVGKPLIPERARMLLALRINVLAKGYSGISLETLQQTIDVFNGNMIHSAGNFHRVELLGQGPPFWM